MELPVRALLTGLGWLVGWWLLWRVRGVPARTSQGTSSVSVVVPARDEERTLPTLLAGLAAQVAPAAEVIVVDDHSADATAATAAAGGARVLASEPLPDGWTGKAWALWQGARAATEDVVVFLDADVEPAPDALARLAAGIGADRGLVSVQPYHRVRRWWERASAFFNVVAVMGVGIGSPRRPRRAVAAFGACMVCRRDTFLEHGSHRSVRAAVLEDVALARRLAAAGQPVTAYAGCEVVAFRMYDRPARMVEGWAKGFAAGAGAIPAMRLVLIAGWMTAVLVAGWGVLGGTWLALALYGVFTVQLLVMMRQVGRFGVVTALLFPVLAAVFVVLFAYSVLLTARGEVRWKGRSIRLRGA